MDDGDTECLLQLRMAATVPSFDRRDISDEISDVSNPCSLDTSTAVDR